MHGVHPNNKYENINIMQISLFVEDVSRIERREGIEDGEFYCAIPKLFLPNGIVTNDTDATDCVRIDCYNSVKVWAMCIEITGLIII